MGLTHSRAGVTLETLGKMRTLMYMGEIRERGPPPGCREWPSGLRHWVRKVGAVVSSPDAGSWLSLLPAVVRLAAISKASPYHTMPM